MSKSVTISAAWITGAATVLAAVVGGVFLLLNRDSGKVSQEMRGSPQSIQAGRDININIGPDRSVPAPAPSSVARFPFDVQVARAKERIKYLAEEYLRTNVMSLAEVTGPHGDNVLDNPNLYDWVRVMEELETQGYVKILRRTQENIEFAYTGKPLSKKQIASIEFKNARPFVDRVVLGNESWRGYMFKVQIENKSSEATIQVKHLKLTDLQQLEGNTFKAWEDAEPVYLEWDGTKSKGIPPQDKVLIPFARIFPPELQRITDGLLSGGVDTPQLRFTVQPGTWPRRMTSHVPPGTHRFKIKVFFEKGPPTEVELELMWPGKQRESVEAMAKEVRIRRL